MNTMSESFWIAIAGIGGAFVSGLVVASCRACFRFKCSSMDFCGMSFERNIELENEAQVLEAQNPPTDVIPRRTSGVIPIRRSSIA
jgi:hypothetical protein